MFTTSSRMRRASAASPFLAILFLSLFIVSCKKTDHVVRSDNRAASYPADVLDKWMTLQLRLMRNSTGIANHAFGRHYAYSGIAALESISPGVVAHNAWARKWNGLSGLPAEDHTVRYYFPANVNAAMASINKAMFPNANANDKQAIDSLEAALNQSFLSSAPQALIETSSAFGKAVAEAVYDWAETDGYKNANNPYTLPMGDGKWVSTFPAFANPATPYWGNNRTVIAGSNVNTDLPAPVVYSSNQNSAFFQMVKKVYDVSQTLTDDQKAMAMFWRDVPGATSPGHWLSIVQQTARLKHSNLETTAIAYALTGAAINDALIVCFKEKYRHSLVRPITYIRDVMQQGSWAPLLGTPAHPEYPSAHSALSSAAADVLAELYGDAIQITDHTYDFLNFQPRTYSSFTSIGEEAGNSRLYAGIHYQQSIDAGFVQGRKVAANIVSKHSYKY